mgnify:CR=1 FL=1
MSARVCLGAFAGAQGVKGAAKVRAFTRTERAVADYGPVQSEDGGRRFTLSFIRVLRPGLAIVSAPEISSREDAAALAGVRFYVDRSALPAAGPDEFYMEDLVGLTVIDEAGAKIGRIVGVHNFGAGDIVEIGERPGRPGTVFAPFTRAAFPEIDLRRGTAIASAEALSVEDGGAEADFVSEAMRQEDA